MFNRLNSKWMGILTLALALLSPSMASAVEENALPSLMSTEILPYFEQGKAGTFGGVDGVSIAYRIFPPANGAPLAGSKAIVLINGRTEFMRKYAELIYDFRNAGYSIYTFDFRGQGESGRLLPDSRLGHVENFRDYVDDLGAFMEKIVKPTQPSEIHGVAHSMGGLVVTIYAVEHPEAFKSMVLSGPMYQPYIDGWQEPVALALAWFVRLFGNDDEVALGRSPTEWDIPFEKNHVTSSRNRFLMEDKMLREDPSLIVAGPTYRWVAESIRGGRWIRKHGADLKTPALVMQAEKDRVVINAAQTQVCQPAKDCQLTVIPEAEHEIYMERDAIRNGAISLTLDFLAKHSGAQAH